ncbi:MAG: Fic family protein [Eubacteriales bacterium]|nr:Fic family protein [Eubacteriales bacterium]
MNYDKLSSFRQTDKMTNLVAQICKKVGRASVLSRKHRDLTRRLENRIQTIHASLSIAGYESDLKEVRDVMNRKYGMDVSKDIMAAQNACDAYDRLYQYKPTSERDLLQAHDIMMDGLIVEAGRYRSGNVGVIRSGNLVYVAPRALLIPGYMRNLFEWYETSEKHPLIKSAIFHYLFLAIHPFADGNGRMVRLWHRVLLGVWEESFYSLPLDSILMQRQSAYVDAIGCATCRNNGALFVTFMLEAILSAMSD